MSPSIIWLILGVVFIAVCRYLTDKKTNNLIGEGKIIKRNKSYWEEGQQYTLRLEDPNLVTRKVEAFPYSEMKVNMKGDKERQVFYFNGYDFDAQLKRQESAAEKSVYCFEFSRWKNNKYGTPYGYYEMNMLMTAVEKMFLSIDPNTQVHTWKLETKTKTPFF